MSLIVVDVEADGPVPGLYSMVCFGAVVVNQKLDKTFYGEVAPISSEWIPDALAVSGFSREDHMQFPDPKETMLKFDDWINKNNEFGSPVFISDNNGFDFPFINYYFHKYLNRNPFGWSSRRISDLFCGFKQDMRFRWKKYRKTTHDHNPVNDAMGNAQALLHLRQLGMPIKI